MRFTIRDDSKTLCASCRFGQCMNSPSHSEPIIWCHEMERRLHFQVNSCSQYKKRGTAEWEYERIAWIIRNDPGKPIGFVRPGTMEHKEMTDD